MKVGRESVWTIDVERTIAGLREAAEALANAGVPADAEITASTGTTAWMHIEAHYSYFTDDDTDDDGDLVPTLPAYGGQRA